jgi:hypothetical protein
VLKGPVELERKVIHGGADEGFEVLILIDRLQLVERRLAVGVVVLLAPEPLGGQALGTLHKGLEVLLGLRIAPARQVDHGPHDSTPDDDRPGREHGHPLHEPQSERITEAGQNAHQSEADRHGRHRREKDPAQGGRLSGHRR